MLDIVTPKIHVPAATLCPKKGVVIGFDMGNIFFGGVNSVVAEVWIQCVLVVS